MSKRNRRITLEPFEQKLIMELLQTEIHHDKDNIYIWAGRTRFLLKKLLKQLPGKDAKNLMTALEAQRINDIKNMQARIEALRNK